jgi:hypothetical protein
VDYINTIPLGQFYEISVDNQKPYYVYGGFRTTAAGGPSGTLNQEGITNDEWFRTGGGDGFYSVVDVTDPNTIYVESQDGNVARLELKCRREAQYQTRARSGRKAVSLRLEFPHFDFSA